MSKELTELRTRLEESIGHGYDNNIKAKLWEISTRNNTDAKSVEILYVLLAEMVDNVIDLFNPY